MLMLILMFVGVQSPDVRVTSSITVRTSDFHFPLQWGTCGGIHSVKKVQGLD